MRNADGARSLTKTLNQITNYGAIRHARRSLSAIGLGIFLGVRRADVFFVHAHKN